jgi:hypothetical protein
MPFEGACNNEEKVTGLTVSYTSLTGRPAAVDGATKFSVQSGDGSVVQSGDHGFEVVSGDALADTVILMKADVDTGVGVEEISDTYTLHVTGAKAAAFGVSGGTVVPK